ncbi:MAG: FlxA-like family protein [Variovorax sp.]|nr:FlxA-like family protein [Variovorax sp.]
MVSAVASNGASSTPTDTASKIAALLHKLTALQKQLTKLQDGEITEEKQQQATLISQQIMLIEMQIAALQAAAVQKAAQQGVQAASASATAQNGRSKNAGPTSGSLIDTVA